MNRYNGKPLLLLACGHMESIACAECFDDIDFIAVKINGSAMK
jgi:hypothetical protein